MATFRSLKFVSFLATALGLATMALAQGGTIVSATYGVGHRRADVTARVQSMVQNGGLNFRVNNDTMGVGDPAPGRVKELHIRVRQWNRHIRDYKFQEGSQVSLQVGGNGGNPYQGRLQGNDQSRFDSYYTRWLQYRRQNNGGEIRSMEKRMQDIYRHYSIPPNTPFDQVASPGLR
jgi:hypothetical protein